jgi:hypothetical protein
MPSPSQPPWFDEECEQWSSSLCSVLLSPVTLSLSGSNTLLNIMFSNILSLCSQRGRPGFTPIQSDSSAAV